MKVKDDFNPMSDLFMAQFEKPAQLGDINLRVLSPFQRALLVIDGTVTKFIEAYTMEPIEIIRLAQSTQPMSMDNIWLDTSKGTDVIVRQVILRGEYSGTLYAYAVSLIVPNRLPDKIKRGLEIDGEGLGRILLGGRMETRRDVLWYGREKLKKLPETIQHLTDGEFISRTYRIFAGGQPIMLINERFPVNTDQLSPLE
jgi:chorismate-pyruvate lyase